MSGIAGKLSFDLHNPLAIEFAGTTAQSTERSDVHAAIDAPPADAVQLADAYVKDGASCVTRLRGPFACAVWDGAARRLVLARDPIGVRPLYYSVIPGEGIVFATDVRTLLADPRVGRAWSARAVDAYLALGYVPAPLTPYERISKVEPAQMLVVEGRRLRAERYWDFPSATRPLAEAYAAEALDRGLAQATRRLVADAATTGLLYSGGVSSSALLTAWPRTGRAPLTVTVDDDPTELTRSGEAADRLGRARDLETFTTPIAVAAQALAAAFDEPIADPSAVNQFATCSALRRATGTAIAGHGGSVLWLGARHHRQAVWDGFLRRDIYTRDFAWRVRDDDPLADHLALYASRRTATPLERALYVDARTFLPDSVLATAHRAAAAAGVELRFPFLEQDLVALAFASAAAPRPWSHRRACVLQQLLQRRLPRPLVPAARAHARPLWLEPAVAALVPSLLMTPRFDGRGIVSRLALQDLWEEHRAGRRDHARRLWALVMLECWFRAFIDSRSAEEPLEYAAIVKVA